MSRPVTPPRRTVSDEGVFAWWDYPAFATLSIVNLVVLAFATWYWIVRGDPLHHLLLFALLTAPFLLGLVLYECRWFALPLMRRPRAMEASAGWRVGVATTFVPGAEPIEMLAATLRGLVRMDYPHDTWVLDEGDDEKVAALCLSIGAHHFSRKAMARYQAASGRFQRRTKHGNYNAWLSEIGFANYDIIVAFDPDHVPAPEFLTRVLGYFDDPRIGFVQAPQVYYNQSASFIARGAAEESYAYYSSVQMTSYAMGYPIVTGCHNSHRVTALKEVGGFAAHDADDMLITLYYRNRGWRGVYVPETLAVGLVPVDWDAYLAQQRRWCRSVLDIKFRLYRSLFRELALPERLASLLHGVHYFYGFTTAVGLCALAFVLVTGTQMQLLSISTVLVMAALALVLQMCEFYRQRFFLHPKTEGGFHWRAGLLRFAKWPLILTASIEAVLNKKPAYAITRKVPGSRAPWALLVAHAATAAMIVGAWAIGVLSGSVQSPVVLLLAAAMVMSALLVCLTVFVRFPDPFNPELQRASIPDGEVIPHISRTDAAAQADASETVAAEAVGRVEVAKLV